MASHGPEPPNDVHFFVVVRDKEPEDRFAEDNGSTRHVHCSDVRFHCFNWLFRLCRFQRADKQVTWKRMVSVICEAPWVRSGTGGVTQWPRRRLNHGLARAMDISIRQPSTTTRLKPFCLLPDMTITHQTYQTTINQHKKNTITQSNKK